jgi:hypothetical protein
MRKLSKKEEGFLLWIDSSGIAAFIAFFPYVFIEKEPKITIIVYLTIAVIITFITSQIIRSAK